MPNPNQSQRESLRDDLANMFNEEETSENPVEEISETPGTDNGSKEPTGDTTPEAVAEDNNTSMIQIGDKEYSMQEVQELASFAQQVKSYEKEKNVDIMSLLPDYTRKSQELAELKTQLDRQQSTQKEPEDTKPESDEESEDEEYSFDPKNPQVKEFARYLEKKMSDKYGLGNKEFLDKDSAKQLAQEEYERREAEKKQMEETQNLTNQIKAEAESFAQEWDGTDGKPKVDETTLLETAYKRGLPVKYALRELIGEEIDAYRFKQMQSEPITPPNAERKGDSFSPEPVEPKKPQTVKEEREALVDDVAKMFQS